MSYTYWKGRNEIVLCILFDYISRKIQGNQTEELLELKNRFLCNMTRYKIDIQNSLFPKYHLKNKHHSMGGNDTIQNNKKILTILVTFSEHFLVLYPLQSVILGINWNVFIILKPF